MAKSKHFAFVKKLLPEGARRITKSDGVRVWLINGKEYPSKRAYFQRNAPDPVKVVFVETENEEQKPDIEELEEVAVNDGILDDVLNIKEGGDEAPL